MSEPVAHGRPPGARALTLAGCALILLVASACGGNGESRLDQGIDAADRAEAQGRAIEEHQRRVEDVSVLTP